MKTPVGIIDYGFYLPRNRISVEEIAAAHHKNAGDISGSLKVTQKAIAGIDEDSFTMAFEASSMIFSHDHDRSAVDAVFVGSETHPYAVKTTSSMLAQWLSLGDHHYQAYDTQFACKAATGALRSGFSAVRAGDARTALICGTDKANAKIGDALEYTAGSGAVALLVGSDNPALLLHGAVSYSSDTPDFWRRPQAKNPSHAGRFTGKPAYFRHVTGAVKELLDQTGRTPDSLDKVVFHMPNGRFPRDAAKMCGFTDAQLASSLVVERCGNSYAASALMGFVATVDSVTPGETVLLASYGSGAGSDAFLFEATDAITQLQKRHPFDLGAQQQRSISYTEYLQILSVI